MPAETSASSSGTVLVEPTVLYAPSALPPRKSGAYFPPTFWASSGRQLSRQEACGRVTEPRAHHHDDLVVLLERGSDGLEFAGREPSGGRGGIEVDARRALNVQRRQESRQHEWLCARTDRDVPVREPVGVAAVRIERVDPVRPALVAGLDDALRHGGMAPEDVAHQQEAVGVVEVRRDGVPAAAAHQERVVVPVVCHGDVARARDAAANAAAVS